MGRGGEKRGEDDNISPLSHQCISYSTPSASHIPSLSALHLSPYTISIIASSKPNKESIEHIVLIWSQPPPHSLNLLPNFLFQSPNHFPSLSLYAWPEDPSCVRNSGIHSFMATNSLVEIRGRGRRNWLRITIPMGSTVVASGKGESPSVQLFIGLIRTPAHHQYPPSLVCDSSTY